MEKQRLIFCRIAAVVLCCFLLCSCGCRHEAKTAATCTEPERCSVCGRAFGIPLGHDWLDADCVTPEICSRCGSTKGEALGHSWKQATQDAPKTCSKCGLSEGGPLESQIQQPPWELLYDDACLLLSEMLSDFEVLYSYDSEEDILYASITAPSGTAETVVLAPDCLDEYWQELTVLMCASGEQVNELFASADFGTDCCIMLLADHDSSRVLLATFNGFVRYDCLNE